MIYLDGKHLKSIQTSKINIFCSLTTFYRFVTMYEYSYFALILEINLFVINSEYISSILSNF